MPSWRIPRLLSLCFVSPQPSTSEPLPMLKNGLIACAAFLLLLGSSGRSAPVGDAELKASDKDASNWLMYGRTYDDHRFSPLKQINDQSISRLGLAWSHEFGTTRGLEATPLVEDGVIYTSGNWSVVYA